MFQFQSGSIKRIEYRDEQSVVGQFQFQSGSIKSLLELELSFHLVCFNSKVVRLKVKNDTLYGPPMRVSIPKWFD